MTVPVMPSMLRYVTTQRIDSKPPILDYERRESAELNPSSGIWRSIATSVAVIGGAYELIASAFVAWREPQPIVQAVCALIAVLGIFLVVMLHRAFRRRDQQHVLVLLVIGAVRYFAALFLLGPIIPSIGYSVRASEQPLIVGLLLWFVAQVVIGASMFTWLAREEGKA